jgi:hypothetical protein
MNQPAPLGNLVSRYNFFLNPYLVERFKHCPQCNGKTETRKVPLVILVDPDYPVSLNYTCRYCASCDLLIAHQKEMEGYLTQMFVQSAPKLIVHDYRVIGTFDQAFWEQGTRTSKGVADLMKNLHGFNQKLDFPRQHGNRFSQLASQVPVQDPGASVEDVEEATRLTEAMKAYLPISARPTRELIKLLRKQGTSMSDRQTLSITSVFYGGNEMGIACAITPPGMQEKAVVCSLTQLEIADDNPLAKELRLYQEKRKAKLAQTPGKAPSSFTWKPKL